MSDTSTSDTTDNEGMQRLRDRAAAADRMERENAMLRAGVDDSTPVGKMFASAYQGDLDVEKVKAAAAEVGALKATDTAPATPVPETTATPAEQTQTEDRAGLASGTPGGEPAPPAKVPARQNALKAYDDASARNETPDQRAAAFFSSVVAGGNAGDKSVIFTGYTPEELGRRS